MYEIRQFPQANAYEKAFEVWDGERLVGVFTRRANAEEWVKTEAEEDTRGGLSRGRSEKR